MYSLFGLGSKIPDEDVRNAEEKFEDSKTLATEAMNNFLDSEVRLFENNNLGGGLVTR